MLDIRRITKYPPEVFMDASPIDLVTGENKVFEYTDLNRRPAYIASLYGLSFASLTGGIFWVNVDGNAKVMTVDNLASVKGLDHEEEVKLPASKSLVGYIYAPSATSSYQFRHKVLVQKPTPVLKLLHGFDLTPRDRELIAKYGLDEAVVARKIQEANPYDGILKVFTKGNSFSSSGIVLRYIVPDGYFVTLLDIAVDRPASAGQASITVTRDGADDIVSLDPYCMQGISNVNWVRPVYTMRINALDELLIEIDVSSGTHNVRVVYGIGKLTIADKIRWDVELSTSEKRIAEREDLYDKVEAGIC